MTENLCTAHSRAGRAPKGDDICKHTRINLKQQQTYKRKPQEESLCEKGIFKTAAKTAIER